MNLLIILLESASVQAYEIYHDFDLGDYQKLWQEGVLALEDGRAVGKKEVLEKWAKKKKATESISPCSDYEFTSYMLKLPKNELADLRDSSVMDVAFADVQPFRQKVGYITALVLHPKGWDQAKLSKMFKYRERWSGDNRGFIKFEDPAQKIELKVEDLPEYQMLDKHFNMISTKIQKTKETYVWNVDPMGGIKKHGVRLMIFAVGYVRVDDGRSQMATIRQPDSKMTDEENRIAAWKAAVKWAKREHYL